MHIHRLEALFMWLAGAMLFMFGMAILVSVFGLGIQLPGNVGQIDPRKVSEEPGFDSPGLREISPGRYEVYMIATAGGWIYTPSQITVPVDSRVTFFLTSNDITHGFKVFDTNINIMIIPGQVSEVTHVFDEEGDFQFYCHEYCGSGHHTMTGVIHVTGADDE